MLTDVRRGCVMLAAWAWLGGSALSVTAQSKPSAPGQPDNPFPTDAEPAKSSAQAQQPV